MSKSKQPKNPAFENALRDAIKEGSDSNNKSAARLQMIADAVRSVKQRSAHDNQLQSKSTAERKKPKKKRTSTKSRSKRKKVVDTGPSLASIASAYGSTAKENKQSSQPKHTESDVKKPFNLSNALTQTATKSNPITWDYQGTTDTQFTLLGKPKGYVEIVVGIDFGTTVTKVVVRETGSRQAWAVPFTTSEENPYLLPGSVTLNRARFAPSCNTDASVHSLKMPLIEGNPSENELVQAAGYLAHVIRHVRGWFLSTMKEQFGSYELGWIFNMGMPASSYSNHKIVNQFGAILNTAVRLSFDKDARNTKSTISRNRALEILADVRADSNMDELPVDVVEIQVYPEIAAQLHGYVASDRWDSERRKFLLVDIGGGTVDSTMVNVHSVEGNRSYVFLKTSVALLGTLYLHKARLDFLTEVAEDYPNGGKKSRQLLTANDFGLGAWQHVPDDITSYLKPPCDAHRISLRDRRFRNEYQGAVTQLILDAKRRDSLTSHRALPVVLCGGGSKNELYRKYLDQDLSQISVSLVEVPVELPRNLDMDMAAPSAYHRLSVAYGLAFEELHAIIGEDSIDGEELVVSQREPITRFVSKDDV